MKNEDNCYGIRYLLLRFLFVFFLISAAIYLAWIVLHEFIHYIFINIFGISAEIYWTFPNPHVTALTPLTSLQQEIVGLSPYVIASILILIFFFCRKNLYTFPFSTAILFDFFNDLFLQTSPDFYPSFSGGHECLVYLGFFMIFILWIFILWNAVVLYVKSTHKTLK